MFGSTKIGVGFISLILFSTWGYPGHTDGMINIKIVSQSSFGQVDTSACNDSSPNFSGGRVMSP